MDRHVTTQTRNSISKPWRSAPVRLGLILAAWCLLPTGGLAALEHDQQRIAETAAQLIALGDRSPGSAGAGEALAILEARLKELGLETRRTRTTIARAIDHGSQVTVDGTLIRLHPHRRNGVAVAGTGGDPLAGPLTFVGRGRDVDLGGKELTGAIVVLDSDSGSAWASCAQLGAIAAIIRGTEGLDRYQVQLQSSDASIEFPRFVVESLDLALDGKQAVITADVRLEPATAETLLARIPGTGKHTEAVLLAAGYESPDSIVGLSPGTTRAWNAAVLLDTARALVAEPTGRDVVVIFHGGLSELMRGLRETVAAMCLERKNDGTWPALTQVSELVDSQRLQAWREDALVAAMDSLPESPTIAMFREAVEGKLGSPPIDGTKLADQIPLARTRADAIVALLAGQHADLLQIPIDAKRGAFTPKARKSMTAEAIQAMRSEIDADDAVYQRYRTVQQKLVYGKDLNEIENQVIGELLIAGRPEMDRHLSITRRYLDDWNSLLGARQILAGAAPIHLIGIDLSDGSNRFAAAVKGPWVGWMEDLGWLTSGLVKMGADLNMQASDVKVAFERAAHDAQDEVDAWFGDTYIHEAGVAGLYLPASTLSTVPDARLRQGSPLDDDAHFRREPFIAQITGLGRFISAYVDAGFIANRNPKGVNSKAPRVETEVRSIGTKTGRRGFPYPLVLVLRDQREISGEIRYDQAYWGDAFGVLRVPFVPVRHPSTGNYPLKVFGFDGHSRITAALASAGVQRTKVGLALDRNQVSDILPLVFRCRSSVLYDIFDPRLLIPLNTINVLSASRDSSPNFFCVDASQKLAAAAIFTEPHEDLRITATQGQVGNRLVLTGYSANERGGSKPTNKNFAPGIAPGYLSPLVALDVAGDTQALNEERIELLRRNGITSDSNVLLHSLAERHLERARIARKSLNYRLARGEAQTAWSLAGRVYPNVLGTANDVVYGLVVMLLFSIPFAWICERLFISGSTIVRKVAGFMGFFVAIFLFFYTFHPAFELATTPMIIFLAFVILIMSAWVIALLYNRFEFEMEQIRMSGMGMHKADVSRLGTLVATVALGISNMRRRPMRTFLTALTVVLMTFILLTFASFNPKVGSQRLSIDAAPPFNGILIRQNGWLELSPLAADRIERIAGDRFDMHQVRWMAPGAQSPRFPLLGPAGVADVAGVTGVEPGDPTGIESALIRGDSPSDSPRGFVDGESWLFLPREVLNRLGATPGGEVRLRGRVFKAGLIDATRLATLTQIGGDPLTPLAYDPSDRSREDENARLTALASDSGPGMEENSSAIHLSPASVAVARATDLMALNGGLRAMSLTPRQRGMDLTVEAEELARQLALTLRVGSGGESWMLTSIGKMSVAGLGAVLIPLILGGMIIFSTMLNSVAERGKEIFIFASLGLAPIHVAALFLVEASIYAVLGGLGGYMVAQLLISVLGLAADLGYGIRPDINYSSFTAVATILLVMATVLLSALYPALVASKAANPGTIDFRVPDPEGDLLKIDFPFTVASRDVRGLCAFLAKYFDMHNEAAAGCFTAADASMRADGNEFEVTAKVWLAPFDLGISQHFCMRCRPTDVKAIFSVHLALDLLSGQRAAWKRTNLAFLKDLRQQFLVWRTLSEDTMLEYAIAGGDQEAEKRLATFRSRQDNQSSNALPATGGVA